jgi:hypothetical protein
MKKKWLILPLLIFVLILTLLPANFLNANPANLVQNGDFETSGGSLDSWEPTNHYWIVENNLGNNYAKLIINNRHWEELIQWVSTNNPNLNFSYNIWISEYNPASEIRVCVHGYQNITNVFQINEYFTTTASTFLEKGYNILQKWQDLNPGTPIPSFNRIQIFVYVSAPLNMSLSDTVMVDNFSLEVPGASASNIEPVWVRTMPMTCYRVWVNEDNKFQFIFWYPYRDNNWVRIYDMSGKMVYEIDMPYDNSNLIVDLPNGMYAVKTFTVGSTEPIQTFVIGKP